MYAKLIFKNARRSIKDYLIYLVTMTICVTLFYSFLSISSAYYHPQIKAAYDFTILGDSMKLSICILTLLLLFLIRYVNHYMLAQRQKEFAIQAVMGMEQQTIGWLFFAETLCMGALSIVTGIFLGMAGSQFITAMLLSDYGEDYQFTWMLFPDTLMLTVGFFTCCFLLVGIFNIRFIRRIKIIDMLAAQHQNGPALRNSRFMHILLLLYLLLLALMLFSGMQMITCYFDPRFALPVHILFWGLILAPILGLLWPAVWLVNRSLRRKRARTGKRLTRSRQKNSLSFAPVKSGRTDSHAFQILLTVETVCTLLNAFAAACVPGMKGSYLLAYGSGVMNQYICYLTVNVIFLICELLYLINFAAAARKNHSPEHRYKGENLFFYGQILSKLAANTKSMILICVTLVLAICLFLAAPVLTGWSLGYLHDRSVYDIQISSSYNKTVTEDELPQGDYPAITRFLADHGIQTAYDHTFSVYLPKRSEFHNRIKWQFPMTAISLSDYNAIREMLGHKPISLENDEFATQWMSIATESQKHAFLENHQTLSTDTGVLSLASHASYDIAIGESIYNLYTDAIYILPDHICEHLLRVKQERYIQTTEPLSYADAQALEAAFLSAYGALPADSAQMSEDSGAAYSICLNTLEVNSILAANFVLKAGMIYGAVVLMVICLTILSLQQLLDASKYQYRFRVLRELGVEEHSIRRLILRQLGVWFALPVTLAVLISSVIAGSFLQMIAAQVHAYIGADALSVQLGATAGILALLLLCYFLSTWILFLWLVEPDKAERAVGRITS